MCGSASPAIKVCMIITSRSKGLKNWPSRLGWSISENPRMIGEPGISGVIYEVTICFVAIYHRILPSMVSGGRKEVLLEINYVQSE